jgi:hypothetical protein
MTKPTIIKWWIWGFVAMMPGTILIPASALALAGHDPGTRDGYGQAMVALITVGGLFILGGLIAQLVAWIAAVRNTHRLADPRWFKALLWGGIAGIVACALSGLGALWGAAVALATSSLSGLGALVMASVMIAYLVAGPDGLSADPRPTIPAKRPITRWAGRGYAIGCAGGALALLVPNLTDPGRPLHGVVWPSLMLVSLGITVVAVGFTIAWAAWWGAIFNTRQLADKTWFHRLLWGGVAAAVTTALFGFGALVLAVVLFAYWRSAPDAMAEHRLPPAEAAGPAAKLPAAR